MILARNTIGIGPWSFDAGPFAIILVIAIVALVVYFIRKDE